MSDYEEIAGPSINVVVTEKDDGVGIYFHDADTGMLLIGVVVSPELGYEIAQRITMTAIRVEERKKGPRT